MKKIIIAVFVVFMLLLVVGCANSNKSIYDDNTRSLNEPDKNYNNNFNDDAKNFYPDYVLPENNENTKNFEKQYDNYFKTNNIKDYKYTVMGDRMKVWINNWDDMAENAKNRIKNDLMKFNRNIKDIEFVKTRNDLD